MGIKINDGNVVLENEYYRRVIDTTDGIATKTFHIKPAGNKISTWYPIFSFEDSAPFEMAITVDGEYYEAAPFKRYSEANLWRRNGAFKVINIMVAKGKFGDTVNIVLNSLLDNMPKLQVEIIYEVADEMPLLSKKIIVTNTGVGDIVINSATVDCLRFFGRTLPLSTFTNYYCDVKKDDLYYFGWTRMEFPDAVDMVLSSGESFESFDLYEAVTAVDRQEESIILHRIYKQLAPWICSLNPGLTVNSCNTTEELYELANSAKENGFEMVSLHVGQLFTNTGDYIPRPELFPNGYQDIKKLVDYFHQNGVKVLPYCSATIAWRDTQVCKDHVDWQCLGEEGLRYEPSSFGNMCYHSEWGDYIKEKLLYLISDEVSFDGLALDGPVHGLVCKEKNHKHKNEKSVNFMNWKWEKEFYSEVCEKNKIITAPETWNAVLFGISQTPGGYREEDQNEYGGLPFVTMTRSCVYESRYATPACAHWTAFNLEDYHGHSIEASEENTASYEHSIAGMFGYGFDGWLFAKKPYIGEKTKEIYFKWLNILKIYKETFLGDFIHIAQPNGYEPDAVLHTNEKAKVPAVSVVFNPTNDSKDFYMSLPLKYAGLKPKSFVLVEKQIIELDSVSNAQIMVKLKPYEVKFIPITPIQKNI